MIKTVFGLKGKKRSVDRKLILDVGTQYVKVLDLTVKKGVATLHNYKILNLISGGRRFVSKEIAKIIKKAILDMKIGGNLAYASVSGKTTIVRFADMPKMSKKELKNSLKYQTDLRLPFSLDEALYDCQIIDQNSSVEGRMKVVVAAVPKKDANKVLDIIQAANLICMKVDVDAIALANSFLWGQSKDDKEAYALVNIGASRTNLTIMENGAPVLCRELNHGGISLTEAISHKLEINFDDAEERKIKSDAQVLAIVEDELKPISTGIQQSFDYYEGSSSSHISKVYLSGGGAQTRGIIDYLMSMLNRTVLLWNPLRSINIDSFPDKELLQANAPLLTIALGIGLGDNAK